MKLNQINNVTVLYKTPQKYFVSILVLLPYFASCLHYEDEWDGADKLTRHWCKSLRVCIPNNVTVCGWDQDASFLAEFENICVLYRANCRGAGKFLKVEMIVCETKKKYDLEHPNGEELEWIHIEGGTSASTTTVHPLTVTNKTSLRHKNEDFRTLYPEGGTLPPNFFDDKSEKESVEDKSEKESVEVLRGDYKTTKTPSDSEWRDKVLELLWRRGARTKMFELLYRRAAGTTPTNILI